MLGMNNKINNNYDEIISKPQDVYKRYRFIIKKKIGSGYKKILFGYDVWKYDDLEIANQEHLNILEKLRKNIDSKIYELLGFNAVCKKDFLTSGIDKEEVDEWSKKLGIPEDYPE